MSSLVNLKWRVISEGPWTKRRKHQVVVVEDKLLLLGGFDGEGANDLNDVWSYDGQEWEKIVDHAEWSGRDGHAAVVHDDGIFILAGTNDPFQCKSDVWKSVDGGKTWMELKRDSPWPQRWQHGACRHDSRIFLSGGWGDKYLNDVWYSRDGVNWIQACASAPWKPRMFHSMFSFQGKLFVLGGHDGKMQLRDIWMSADGGNSWTEICEHAPWPSRQGQATVVIQDSVYVMGGFGGSERLNDVWKSSDCVHWSLVNAESPWPERQGHAAVYFKGSILVLGGFDATGYSNAVYGLLLDDATSIDHPLPSHSLVSKAKISDKSFVEDNPTDTMVHARKQLTETSLESVIKQAGSLKMTRENQQNVAHLIVDVIGIVTRIFQYVDYEQRKRNSSNDLSCLEIDKRISLGSTSNISRNPFHMMGSPFLENALEKVRVADSTELSTLVGMKTSPYHFWQRRNPEYHDSDQILHNPGPKTATIWGTIEGEKRSLKALNQAVRMAASNDDIDKMHELMAERETRASSGIGTVENLMTHLNQVSKIHEERENDLLGAIARLEDIQNQFGQDQQKFTEDFKAKLAKKLQDECIKWEDIVKRGSIVITYHGKVEGLLRSLSDNMKNVAAVTNQVADWLVHPDTNILEESMIDVDNMDLDDHVVKSGNVEESSQRVALALRDFLDEQAAICEVIMKTSKEEILDLENLQLELYFLLTVSLNQGIDAIQQAHTTNTLTCLEIAKMKEELADWLECLSNWRNAEKLREKCDGLIKSAHELEDRLVSNEDWRIDLKSNLEKAVLKSSRGKMFSRASSSASTPTAGNSLTPNGGMVFTAESPVLLDIDKLKADLACAEKNSKLTRRQLRNWYRENRKFAVNVAGELFHYLPDFRSPGSVLGDGGFAEIAKIPHRNLTEYDDIAPFSENGGQDGQTGRHLLLRASFEGEEVMLKGFIMHNHDQRKGMDREIAILSNLRSDMIISPRAIVDATDDGSLDPSLAITLFIEYPFYKGGNLSSWLKSSERKPWELQAVARQILYALMYLHDHGVIHRDIKPSNVLLQEDGRIVLTDFELARAVGVAISAEEEEYQTITRSGTSGFIAPEVESGGQAVFGSDMYSYGMLLYFMNFPKDFSQLVPGQLRFPSHVDGDLSNIITQMVALEPSSRPSAATALTHPYFRATFVDRLMEEGEIVEQDRKLDAVRNLLSRTRYSYRNIFEKVTVRRSHVLDDVIQYFKTVPIEKLKHHLRVTFANEPGVDEGGLLTEMFSIFFDVIFHPGSGLFEDCFGSISHNESSEDGNATMDGNVVLPSTTASSSSHIESFRAVGKAMVKAFYEGRRIGNRLSPSAFKFFTGAQPNTRDLQLFDPQTAKSLQWMLATVGVEDLGFHFETVGKPELGEVDDNNKGTFVRMKTESVLIQSRIKQLTALKEGFLEALQGISTEAAPFLNLLSHTDWRIMLCGDTVINPQQIVAALRFSGFPTRSKIPQWLTELICSASEDHLRKFLIFVTGSPSITNSFSSSSSSSSTIRINVRHQTRSAALPTAHTCFFHLDIPDYAEKETFQNKLLYAIQNSNTFEIV